MEGKKERSRRKGGIKGATGGGEREKQKQEQEVGGRGGSKRWK